MIVYGQPKAGSTFAMDRRYSDRIIGEVKKRDNIHDDISNHATHLITANNSFWFFTSPPLVLGRTIITPSDHCKKRNLAWDVSYPCNNCTATCKACIYTYPS
jgi:hypothetical protein